eukprot:tig00020961_g16731.t1
MSGPSVRNLALAFGRSVRGVRPAPLRGGAVTPVRPHKGPDGPIPEEFELTWDDGANPEFLLDEYQYGIGKYEALMTLLGVFGGMVGLWQVATWWDAPSRRPTIQRDRSVLPPLDLDHLVAKAPGLGSQ